MAIEHETLINLHPKTDFEKLLWAKNLNKELQDQLKSALIKNGELISEIAELKDFIKKNKDLGNAKKRHDAEIIANELKKEVKRLKKINENLTNDNIYLKSINKA